MIKINEDKEYVAKIKKKLEENKEKYSKQFFPCVIPSLYTSNDSNDYVCMCKEFRDQEEGMCRCGLYYKTKD